MDSVPPAHNTDAPQPPDEGTQIAGNVNTDGGDFTGRDQTIQGDAVGRDKVGRDLYHVSAEQVFIHHYQTPGDPAQTSEPLDATPAAGESPYMGLQFFDVDDAELFYGREQLTTQLVAHLRHQRFLAVVGASGSGKSSLVRAGLVSALTKSEPMADGTLPPEGSTRWLIHILTPTAHPLKALAASLTRDSESVTVTATLMDDLARDGRSLDLYVSRMLSRRTSITPTASDCLLLVVDQLEELFTLCREKSERKAFVDNLLTAAEFTGQTRVVLTLRSDFYAQCAEFDNLRQALEHQQKYIGAMRRIELRRIIEEPAHQGEWQLEPGLVELMLQDVGDEPGALPLLSHALLETWKRQRGRTLTFAGYQASGRVQGAIAQTAEALYQQQLNPEQQRIARTIFLHLTELGEGMQDTRRLVTLNELMPRPEDTSKVKEVLRKLVDARLVTTFEDTAEVAHEALIREWPTLREWLTDNREVLRLHRHLTAAAQEWQTLGRDAGALYRGVRLAQTVEWLKDQKHELTVLEHEFLTASQAMVVAAEQEQERSA